MTYNVLMGTLNPTHSLTIVIMGLSCTAFEINDNICKILPQSTFNAHTDGVPFGIL